MAHTQNWKWDWRGLLQADSNAWQPDPAVTALAAMYAAFRAKQYAAAAQHFQEALRLTPGGQPGVLQEPTLVNLAHTLRKQRQYTSAIRLYQQALGLCPLRASTHTALGYTYQLQGNAGAAVEQYHKALGLAPDDTFAGEMLTLALQDWAMYESAAGLN